MRPDGRYANRERFLVNPQGVVVKHCAEVDPDTHTEEVLTDLEQPMAAQDSGESS